MLNYEWNFFILDLRKVIFVKRKNIISLIIFLSRSGELPEVRSTVKTHSESEVEQTSTTFQILWLRFITITWNLTKQGVCIFTAPAETGMHYLNNKCKLLLQELTHNSICTAGWNFTALKYVCTTERIEDLRNIHKTLSLTFKLGSSQAIENMFHMTWQFDIIVN